MKRRASNSVAAGLFAVGIVFGLAVLMVIKEYSPEVITAVVTGTSLAAAELVRRLQLSPAAEPERRVEEGRDPAAEK